MTGENFAPGTRRQYSLVADGRAGALIGPHGEVVFLCAPSWHEPPIFAWSTLDPPPQLCASHHHGLLGAAAGIAAWVGGTAVMRGRS